MPNHDITPPQTGDDLKTMSPASQRKLWRQGVLVGEQTDDFWQQFEGKSSQSPIWMETDTAKGRGQTITFTTRSGYYKEPKRRENLFNSPSDFEKTRISDFSLTVDWIRHAVRGTKRMEELMGMRNEIRSKDNIEQGKWLGRVKSDEMFGLFQLKLPSDNIFTPGGVPYDQLKSADTMLWDDIVENAQAMKPMGGLPANIKHKDGKQPIWSQMVVMTETALGALKLDPTYKTVLASDHRGPLNTMFGGGYRNIDGHSIVPYNPIDHDGCGAVGSFLNPKAFLGEAIVAGTGAIAIKGGGTAENAAETDILFFKHFPNYAYEFTDHVHTPETGTRYFLIYNRTGADAGKAGMYAYTTGNNGNQITITGRLGSAASGVRATTLGGVTWNSGVWTGKHTDAHPLGSLIIPCNALGQPTGDTLILGRAAAYRGYGMYRGHRSQQDHEGGFVMDRFITSVFGQTLRKDRAGRVPAAIRVTHAVNYPGVNLPKIV